MDIDKINELPGFWSGLWHGIMSQFYFIHKIYHPDTEVYQCQNNGLGYDFGFTFLYSSATIVLIAFVLWLLFVGVIHFFGDY